MTAAAEFEIFLAAAPGLETVLREETVKLGFARPRAVPGGVTLTGGWPEVWRANLQIRGAGRVLARIGSFRAMHLAQLDKRARRIAWRSVLRPDVPFRVEATCKGSRIYHSGAAAQRIETAIREELGARCDPEAPVCVRARIEDDLCTLAVDTSGEPLHKRGFKVAVGKAPMRETLASLFLRQCGYDGTEPVLDPMCGSGTFVIEAAEIAAALMPGRARSFAFEHLATFDPAGWRQLRASKHSPTATLCCHGSDRDAGAVAMSRANAERAGVAAMTEFRQLPISEISVPAGPPGLVVCNPPYGDRIGDRQRLAALYRALGQRLLDGFAGWRVGIVTSVPALVQATGLPFVPPGPPVAHGGLRISLFQTPPLA